MDGIVVAWRAFVTAHKFLFWAIVAMVARWWVEFLHAIHWHQEASRELLVINPRTPKDAYDNGYALFAYDIAVDCWVGHWRSKDATKGSAADETYAWREQWTGIPFHEVEFSKMPEITFKIRAVSVDWCRKQLRVGEGAEVMKAAAAQIDKAVSDAEARESGKLAVEQAQAATKH